MTCDYELNVDHKKMDEYLNQKREALEKKIMCREQAECGSS